MKCRVISQLCQIWWDVRGAEFGSQIWVKAREFVWEIVFKYIIEENLIPFFG